MSESLKQAVMALSACDGKMVVDPYMMCCGMMLCCRHTSSSLALTALHWTITIAKLVNQCDSLREMEASSRTRRRFTVGLLTPNTRTDTSAITDCESKIHRNARR